MRECAAEGYVVVDPSLAENDSTAASHDCSFAPHSLHVSIAPLRGQKPAEQGRMTIDTLSEVLRVVRLEGAVFFDVDASAPWVAETPSAREIGPHIMPGVEHVIEYHVVTSGNCWGGIVDEEPIRLTTGDVIVFPQGDAHVLSSAPGMRGLPDIDWVQVGQASRLPLAIKTDGGGDERTGLVCGFLGCDARPFNPLLSTLPRVIHLARGAAGNVIEQLIQLSLAETMAKGEGATCALSRLSELLFVEVVRRYLSTLPPEGTGWLAGLRDDAIGRTLAKLHERPEYAWTLPELAREVAISRTVLVERFTQLVGMPPMQYLTRWRMQLAASMLSSTTLNLAEIAGRVGYGSETALSHAFKRMVGVAPADWRRDKRRPG